MYISKKFILALAAVFVIGCAAGDALAQTSEDASYVPLIGISSVPEPLALPEGAGTVTYHYAVKNFLKEAALTDVQVSDDKCSPIKFIEGDDNHDSKLDYAETWRYTCETRLSVTTQSIATAIGTANNLPAAHKAYATVVVGSSELPPLVNIINVTKVAYPLTLPSGGGDITFTYRVNNPGIVPLSDVVVIDDKCSAMSGKLGDTNGNDLLDITEVWIYTCTTHLSQTTTNTVSVAASANGLKAVGYSTITITVAAPIAESSPGFPDTGANPNYKIIAWTILSGVLAALTALFFLIRKGRHEKARK